jgi:(S)-ureidoglycine aminohydrolase
MSHETIFCFYLIYCDQGGGSQEPEFEPGVESFVFVLSGRMRLKVGAEMCELIKGGFAYIPPDSNWSILNPWEELLKFIWVRKLYEPIRDLTPELLFSNEQEVPRLSRFSNRRWSQRLIPENDIAYDMHININTFEPGASIPMVEAHVMQHGIYILQGQGMYLLNEQWHEVREGDYIWLHAWCPQACYAGGDIPMRYLLFKNTNRQFSLRR